MAGDVGCTRLLKRGPARIELLSQL
jgi:hypothetical protein